MNSRCRKYLSPSAYLRQALWVFNTHVLHSFDILTAPPFETTLKYPPVFIIGAPRSGSTLLYQVLTDAFELAYMSNRHCQFFGSPALAERLFKPLEHKTSSDYTSYHGQTKGPSAPSECGSWWYRFFRHDPAYVTLNDVAPRKMQEFRRSLLAFTQAAGKPVLFKNLYATIRLEAIGTFIPEALFIVIKRHELFNAASILKGRKKALGNYEEWWSVPPPAVEQLKKRSPVQQVVGQIRHIHHEIYRVVANGFIASNRIIECHYETLCRDTPTVLHQVESFFHRHNVSVSRSSAVPKSFAISNTFALDGNLLIELQRICLNHESSHA